MAVRAPCMCACGGPDLPSESDFFSPALLSDVAALSKARQYQPM